MNSNKLSLRPEKIPRHIAIIMDGNGRWAKKRALNRIKGHREGTNSVRDIVRSCRELGVEILTLYAFSTENWKRPKTEVSALMKILKEFLRSEVDEMMENGIRLKAIGEIERLPQDALQVLQDTMERTRNNTGMVLNLALSYGGRHEIVRAAKQIARDAKEGKIGLEEISDTLFSRYLYTSGVPDPDLLIRTSGEIRLSNFLLWQIAYTEICVTETYWPDFRREELYEILHIFQNRERRFGLTGDQIKGRSNIS